MSKEKGEISEEDRQVKNTTTVYLKSKGIADIYRYRKEDNLDRVLAQFIDIETGICLECGLVHGFTNIDEARKRRKNNSPYLDRLFWPEVPI
jgi:hypothetical protein